MKHRIMTTARKQREERERENNRIMLRDGGESMQIWDIYK
jgi:hypothetical protein